MRFVFLCVLCFGSEQGSGPIGGSGGLVVGVRSLSRGGSLCCWCGVVLLGVLFGGWVAGV